MTGMCSNVRKCTEMYIYVHLRTRRDALRFYCATGVPGQVVNSNTVESYHAWLKNSDFIDTDRVSMPHFHYVTMPQLCRCAFSWRSHTSHNTQPHTHKPQHATNYTHRCSAMFLSGHTLVPDLRGVPPTAIMRKAARLKSAMAVDCEDLSDIASIDGPGEQRVHTQKLREYRAGPQGTNAGPWVFNTSRTASTAITPARVYFRLALTSTRGDARYPIVHGPRPCQGCGANSGCASRCDWGAEQVRECAPTCRNVHKCTQMYTNVHKCTQMYIYIHLVTFKSGCAC